MNQIRKTESKLLIYQKYVDLIDYGYNLLIKYPKIEKYALASQIRNSMYQALKYILYANKIANKYNKLDILNKLDAEIAIQSYFLPGISFEMQRKFYFAIYYI